MKKIGCVFLLLVFLASCFPAQAEEAGSRQDAGQQLPYEIASAVYPSTSRIIRINTKIPYGDAVSAFLQSSGKSLLTVQKGENKLYSPLNLWMALHLLSSVTLNDSLDQIVRGLSFDSRTEMNEQAKALWLSQYVDDEEAACVPSASIWLNENVEIQPEAVEDVTRIAHASVFQGNMKDQTMTEALRTWLNRQTANLLSDYVEEIDLDPELMVEYETVKKALEDWRSRQSSSWLLNDINAVCQEAGVAITNEKVAEALQAWLDGLNANSSGGPLSDISLDANAQVALFTTLYFRSNWNNEFSEGMNERRIFHAPTGNVEREFMKQTRTDYVYFGANFSAFIKSLKDGSNVVFLLPEAGVLPETVMQGDEVYQFLSAVQDWSQKKRARVIFSMPKLDYSVDVSMKAYLESIGVKDVFDPASADFSSALSVEGGLILSDVKQCVRVKMDEEGVAAAAITRMMLLGSAPPPPDEIEFILDRPFAFAILGLENVPLFLGVVNMP